MARPKKNTADYFPHLCNHGKKMGFIERRHGNDGYATWYKLLEKLAQAHDHFLDLEDEIEVDFLADFCLVEPVKLRGIIADLVKLGALNSEAWGYGIVYSDVLLESLADLYARRKDKPRALVSILTDVRGVNVDINNSKDVVYVDIKPHSIGEESKVEENIEPLQKTCFDHLVEIFTGISQVEMPDILSITNQVKDVELFGKLAKERYYEAKKGFEPSPYNLCRKVFAEINKPKQDLYTPF